jgi:hypothetical protein
MALQLAGARRGTHIQSHFFASKNAPPDHLADPNQEFLTEIMAL